MGRLSKGKEGEEDSMKKDPVRYCPMCAEYLKNQPGLTTNIEQKLGGKNKYWYHTTKRGRLLHEYILRQEGLK